MTIIELHQAEQQSRNTHLVPLTQRRLAAAKASYTVRHVDFNDVKSLLIGELQPRAGDLVLARIARLGQHKRVELGSGRRAHLHINDEVLLCYGARYAPDQYEALVPDRLEPCDMVAAGGVAAHCRHRHASIKPPTRIDPIGLLADHQGRRINCGQYGLAWQIDTQAKPPVYGVLGTMMNAGKTTSAAMLVRGLRQSGLRTGAAKVTGTGAGCDRWVLSDAGADMVLDFTDMGVPSTYGLSAEQVEQLFKDLVAHLSNAGMEAIVVEIADGLFQREAAELLRSDYFRSRCEGVIFAASDALGAQAGIRHLQASNYQVLAASGTMTASPLAIREASQVLDVPVLTATELASGDWQPATSKMIHGQRA